MRSERQQMKTKKKAKKGKKKKKRKRPKKVAHRGDPEWGVEAVKS